MAQAPPGRLGPAMHAVAGLRRDPAVRRGLWIVLFFVCTALLFASVTLPQEVDLHQGEVAPYTIKAPRNMENQPATAAAQQAAENRVADVYRIEPSAVSTALAHFDNGWAAIQAARQTLAAGASGASASAGGSSATAASASVAAGVRSLSATLGLGLPAADIQGVLTATVEDVTAVEGAARQNLTTALDQGISQSGLAAAKAQLQNTIQSLPAPAAVDEVFAVLAEQSIAPDSVLDQVKTQAAQQRAASLVTPELIARGQVIVPAGYPVTADEITLLQEAGLLHPGGRYGILFGAALVSLLFLALLWAFLAQFYPRALRNELHLVLIGSVLVASLATARVGLTLSPFLVPVPWVAMLTVVAFGPGVGLFVAGLDGLAAGLLVHSLTVAAVGVTGAWTAVFTLRRLEQRGDLLRSGVWATLAETAAALLLLVVFPGSALSGGSILSNGGANHALLWDVGAAAFISLISGMLAIGTLPFAEALGVLTPFKLLELANPSQPLLRRLLTEAPGTYHHSLMVANLAESACQAIGADPLLCRAGAYYHDIGKMKRPFFFVENQMGGANPHDQLSARLSARVIISHVADGVELARQARLPSELVDLIRTHHGTTLVQYFYNSARLEARRAGPGATETAAQEPVEADYRYEGPLPSSREGAVLMLADGVEASVRALPHPGPDDIETWIRRIISDRLDDGQLEEAQLTLRDLHAISITFQGILLGAYHGRLEYPETLAGEVTPPAPHPAVRKGVS